MSDAFLRSVSVYSLRYTDHLNTLIRTTLTPTIRTLTNRRVSTRHSTKVEIWEDKCYREDLWDPNSKNLTAASNLPFQWAVHNSPAAYRANLLN